MKRNLSTVRAGEVQSIFIENGILYTGSWGEMQVNMFDISDASSPRYLSSVPLDGYGDGLFVKNGLLYAAFGQHLRAEKDAPREEWWGKGNGFAIWDISNPLSPKKISATFLPYTYYCINWDMWNVTLSGKYAVLSHTFNGVWVYDVSDPENPIFIDHVACKTDKPMTEMMTENCRTALNPPR